MKRVGVSKMGVFYQQATLNGNILLVTKFNTRFSWGPFDHQRIESQNQVLQEIVKSLKSVMHTIGCVNLREKYSWSILSLFGDLGSLCFCNSLFESAK